MNVKGRVLLEAFAELDLVLTNMEPHTISEEGIWGREGYTHIDHQAICMKIEEESISS